MVWEFSAVSFVNLRVAGGMSPVGEYQPNAASKAWACASLSIWSLTVRAREGDERVLSGVRRLFLTANGTQRMTVSDIRPRVMQSPVFTGMSDRWRGIGSRSIGQIATLRRKVSATK